MAEEQFFIFVNIDNDLEESDEISDHQLHQSEIDENEPDEKCTVKNIPLHIEINNAFEVIRHFLEMKPNSDFSSFYKLENHLTYMMLSEKNKQTKISDYFTSK